jgi:hypothetical protein
MVTAGTVIGTAADLDESLTEVAVRVTVTLVACDAGGVYVVGDPLEVNAGVVLPHDAREHDTVQVTPLSAVSFVTVAVAWVAEPTSTVAEVGETAMVMFCRLPPPHAMVAASNAIVKPQDAIRRGCIFIPSSNRRTRKSRTAI